MLNPLESSDSGDRQRGSMRGLDGIEPPLGVAGAECGRPLKDPEIRASLTRWLRDHYRDELDTAFYEEFAIPRPTARADLAVVNGALVGFEIKSDVDTAARLASQAKSYGYIFDRMYLVTTEKRKGRLSAAVPTWWGIIHAKSDGTVERVRASKLNRKVGSENVLHLLNRAELERTAQELEVKYNKGSKRGDIIKRLVKAKRKTCLLEAARLRLKERKKLA